MNTTYLVIVSALSGALLFVIIYFLFLRAKRSNIDKDQLNDVISRIATEALDKNSERMMTRVKELLTVEKSAIKVDLDGKKSAINELIQEIRKDIHKNEQRLEKSDEERVRTFSSLKSELEDYKKITGDLKISTEKLRNLLSNNQMRGAFGEQIAETY